MENRIQKTDARVSSIRAGQESPCDGLVDDELKACPAICLPGHIEEFVTCSDTYQEENGEKDEEKNGDKRQKSKDIKSTIAFSSASDKDDKPSCPGTQAPGEPASWTANIFCIFERIIDGLFTVLLVSAALLIVVSGYLFMTVGGDREKARKARNYALYALVAVTVAFIARALVMLIDWIVRSGA